MGSFLQRFSGSAIVQQQQHVHQLIFIPSILGLCTHEQPLIHPKIYSGAERIKTESRWTYLALDFDLNTTHVLLVEYVRIASRILSASK